MKVGTFNSSFLIASLISLFLLFNLKVSNALLSNFDTLVLFNEDEDFLTYSNLFEILKENRLKPNFQKIGSDNDLLILDINNENLYKNILLLPNKSKKLSSKIDYNTILQFSNNGGNLMIVSEDSGTQLDLTIFLNQLGIYPSPKGYKFIDYHDNNNNLKSFKPNFLNNYIIDNNKNNEISSISFENSSVALISNSEFLIPLLQTNKTSFTKNSDDLIWHYGNQGYLSVAFQGLNNGRVLWLGSSACLQNNNNNNNNNFNNFFINDLIQWTFQLKSVIKATFTNHKRINPNNNLEIPFIDDDDYYKIKDFTNYEIGLSKYEFENDKWIPFTLDDENDKIQLEFIMLDPYYRLNLNHTSNTENEAIYSAIFKIPDQHGMFTFSVDYKRPGLSFIKVEDIVPIRHLANDEYARSWEIPNSKVYMAGYGVVVIGWLFFIFFFIFSSKKNLNLEKKNI